MPFNTQPICHHHYKSLPSHLYCQFLSPKDPCQLVMVSEMFSQSSQGARVDTLGEGLLSIEERSSLSLPVHTPNLELVSSFRTEGVAYKKLNQKVSIKNVLNIDKTKCSPLGHAGCPLLGVGRCLLLGCSKCIISIGRAIRGMGFVHCTEVVRLLESPLLEVSLYTKWTNDVPV